MVAGLYIEVTLICMVILGIMIYKLENISYKKKEQHFLTASMIASMGIFACDALWASVDGGYLKAGITFNTIINSLYFIFTGISSYLWFLYVIKVQDSKISRNKTLIGLLSLPCIVLIILTVNSPVHKWIFYIDENNIYHRGNFYMIQVAIGYGYIIVSAIISIYDAFQKQNYIQKSLYLSFGFFPILPLAFIALQVYLPGYPLFSVGLTIPMMIVYIKLRDAENLGDEITLLHNRNWFFRMHDMLRKELLSRPSQYNDHHFFLILVDIDHLDAINHKYGIEEGNHALRLLAFALNNQTRKDNGCIFNNTVRYGGDEFLLTVELIRPNAIGFLLDSINKDIRRFKDNGVIDYDLSVSMAYIPYSLDVPYAQDLLEAVDEELYNVKKAKMV